LLTVVGGGQGGSHSKGNVSMSVQHPDLPGFKRSTKIIFVNSRVEGGWISQGSWWKIFGGEISIFFEHLEKFKIFVLCEMKKC